MKRRNVTTMDEARWPPFRQFPPAVEPYLSAVEPYLSAVEPRPMAH